MSAAEDPEGVERVLRSYRRARTYPKTIRKLANLDLPYPVTVPQLATWIGLFAALWYTRPIWIGVAGAVQLLILLLVPTAAAVALRHLRLEGRSPLAMTSGLITLLAAPRSGTLRGRPLSQPKRARYAAVLIIEGSAPLDAVATEPDLWQAARGDADR